MSPTSGEEEDVLIGVVSRRRTFGQEMSEYHEYWKDAWTDSDMDMPHSPAMVVLVSGCLAGESSLQMIHIQLSHGLAQSPVSHGPSSTVKP